MSETKPFPDVILKWTEVFAQRNIREFKQFMDEEGLSPSQAHALFRLYYGGTCGVSQAAAHLGITDAAASQMVERLVQRGLMERTEHPDDRRVKHLALTAAGRAMVEKTIALRRLWLERLTNELTPQEQEMIAAALTTLIEAANRLE
jgi:DNA-binding MarR family transcriptional regulator